MLSFVFSGHQSFAPRISWFPKAVAAIEAGIDPFSDPRKGMSTLGLGKNMVESLAFWVQAAGVAVKNGGVVSLTDFSKTVLVCSGGFDPFLENLQTLWILHWNLCQGWRDGAGLKRPYAWHFFSSVFQDDEIIASEAIDHFAGSIALLPKPLSAVTLRQHFDIFMRTYVPGESTGSRSTPEDSLDSPLTALALVKRCGEKKLPHGKRETVYRFNSAPKPSISDYTFRYCLSEWWDRAYPNEMRLTLRDISFSEGGPGRVFRLPEADIHRRLIALTNTHPKEWALIESQNQRGIQRSSRRDSNALLKSIYNRLS